MRDKVLYPATLLAGRALLIALSGTGYALSTLPRNSVGTPQLKNSAVTGAKVKNGSLTASDFAAGQLPAGARGERGPQGAAGVAGTARAYAQATGAGVAVAARTKGIASVSQISPGTYCVLPDAAIDPAITVPLVGADDENDATSFATGIETIVEARGGAPGCTGFVVVTGTRDGVVMTLQDQPFFIAIT